MGVLAGDLLIFFFVCVRACVPVCMRVIFLAFLQHFIESNSLLCCYSSKIQTYGLAIWLNGSLEDKINAIK